MGPTLRSIKINTKVIYTLILVLIGELARLVVQNVGLGLVDKIAVSCVYVLVAYIYMFKYCIQHKMVTNVFFFLLILSIFFYYGQHILALFDRKYLLTQQGYHILDGRLSDASIIHATFLIIECLLVVFAGFVCLYKTGEQEQHFTVDEEDYVGENKLQALRIGGWIFIAISIYPTIRYLLAQYSLTELYGYLGRRNLESQSNYYSILGVSTTYIYISGLFLPALYALFIGYRRKTSRLVICILVILYCVLYYITGSRYMILKLLITIFLIQTIWIKPITKSDVKKYLIFAIILAAIFSIGNIIRSAGTAGMSFSDAASELNIGGMLWEPGITFTTVSNILETCPSQVDLFYGKSIIGSILQCLPPALRFGFFDKYTLQVSSVFSPLYYHTKSFGYGSSFIAEAYYNFGYGIFIFMFIFGLLLGKINKDLMDASSNNAPYLFLILSALCGSLAFGVRNDLSSIPREMLTTVIVVALVVKTIELFINTKIKWTGN